MSENLFGRSGGGLAGGLSGGMKAAAVALLVQQLMKHSGGQAAPSSMPQGSPMGGDQMGGLGGGLGGLLGGLLGGGAAGGMLGGGAAGGLLNGLGGLLGGLRSQGFEQHVDSWVQPGPNQHVSPDELSRAFDPQDIDAAAQQAGTDRGTLMNEVSRLLPEMVDRMTPHGRLPQHEGEVHGGSMGGLLNSIFGGGHNPQR
jgi:uncharacterized protein YidB (DUF937 family)